MMITRNITTQILAALMGLAVLFPSIIQFEHLFEEHEHIACSESTSHIHASDFDCNLYDFHISSMDVPSLRQFHFNAVLNYSKTNTAVVSLYTAEKDTQHFLRGPPVIQQYC